MNIDKWFNNILFFTTSITTSSAAFHTFRLRIQLVSCKESQWGYIFRRTKQEVPHNGWNKSSFHLPCSTHTAHWSGMSCCPLPSHLL